MLSCENCKAYFLRDKAGKGQCRLNPPQATLVMAQGFGGQPQPAVLTFYPEVAPDDGCGQGIEKVSKILS
jgi:hypothetical protein